MECREHLDAIQWLNKLIMNVQALAALLLVVVALPAWGQVGSSPLFSDAFDRTTGLGSNWNIGLGSFVTDGQFAVSGAPPASGNWASVGPSVGTNDYAVVADIIIPPGSTFSGVVARSSVLGHFDETLYSAQISTSGAVNLYRRNGWNWTQLGSVAAGIVAGTQYGLALVTTSASPVHLEVWLNGTKLISYDDSSSSQITGGIPGIENYDASVEYNSITVYSWHSLFRDDFVRTTGLGSNWKVALGSFTTDGNAAVSGTPSASGNWVSLVPSVGTSDYSVVADIVIPSGSTFSGVVARSSAAGSFDKTLYSAQISTSGAVNLYRRNGWNWTQLGTVAAAIGAGTKYTLGLVTTGASPVHLEVWLNNAKVLSFDDSSSSQIASGIPGIENYDANVKYDSFAVYSATGGGSVAGGGGGGGGGTGLSFSWPGNPNPSTVTQYPLALTGATGAEPAYSYSLGGWTTVLYDGSGGQSPGDIQLGTFHGRLGYQLTRKYDGAATPSASYVSDPMGTSPVGITWGPPNPLNPNDPTTLHKTVTIAFSLYIPSATFPMGSPSNCGPGAVGFGYGYSQWALFQQFHSLFQDAPRPSLGGLVFVGTLSDCSGGILFVNKPGTFVNGNSVPLWHTPLPTALDKWWDFALTVTFNGTNTGQVIVYVNGSQVAKFDGLVYDSMVPNNRYNVMQDFYRAPNLPTATIYETPVMVPNGAYGASQ